MLFKIIGKGYMCFLLLSLTTSLHAQQALRDIDAKLDSIFGHYDKGEKPGVSIAIIEKDKPPVLKSYGHANLEYQIKNTSNTLFNATDLAKQFTVFSILILQDQGKLSINDNIKKYLPILNEWPYDITLKHLMEQTSGLRDVMELQKWSGYQNGDVITKQDILNIMAKQRYLNFPSGSKFEYNRTGFVLLIEVIAAVSGMPFSTFVHQHIFTPLGMTNSVFVNAHTELIPNRTYSYDTTENGYTKIPNNASFLGGTNLYTSTSDFAKWLQNMSKHRIGKPALYTYLQTKVKLSNGQKSNYTPGIYKDDSEGYWTIHLEGFDHGYTAYMMYVPEHDFALVFFSNDFNFSISDAYQGLYGWFNSHYNIPPVKPTIPQSVKFISKSTADLQNYTGNYLFEDNFSLRKIILENDTLFYVRSKTNRTPFVPIEGNHTFKMLFPDNDNIRVTFKDEGETLEFREITSGGNNDYVTLGRKLKFRDGEWLAFSRKYKNESLDHSIILESTNQTLQLTMGGSSIVLDQIGDNEFLPQTNAKVDYVKLERDDQQNIIGVYLSGWQIRNLYYKMINE